MSKEGERRGKRVGERRRGRRRKVLLGTTDRKEEVNQALLMLVCQRQRKKIKWRNCVVNVS